MAAAQRIGMLAIDALGADGINLLHCSGEAAWQTVPHFHIHVVPRYSGDPLELPWLPVQGNRGDLAVVAARLRETAASRGERSDLSPGQVGHRPKETRETRPASDELGPG